MTEASLILSLDSRHRAELPLGGDAERRFNVPPTIDLGKVIYFGSESYPI